VFPETTMSKQIQQLRPDLTARFPERKDVIDGAVTAVLAGEHVLLLGPPGTAKSALARAIAQAFGGVYFERLLTKFSTPEELFGAISLKALEQDRFVRVVTGKLPEAEFAFVDEVFKANSAILNSLLSLVNERMFHNDGQPVACPLVTMFGASNELPEGKELEALFDRFLLRFEVGYLLRPASLKLILAAPDPVATAVMTMKDLRAAQGEVAKVSVTDETVDALIQIRDACKAEGIIASDRRWKKTLKLAQATAFMAGEKKTSPEDLSILVDSLWREPKDRPKVARLVGKLADPVGAQAAEILDAARETAAKVTALVAGDRKAYIAQAAQALEQFQAQQKKLAQLAKGAGRRASVVIQDSTDEIIALHTELARNVSAGLGLRSARS
jgi:MoxR-like ATPase